jgi:glucosyl-3-phosphoglycerate synthase
MIGQPLVDELVVIDSDSTDETATLAKQQAQPSTRQRRIRPDLGWQPGKGEAMWKSLFVCTGDLIVFVDGDLTSFRVEYVTGLIGPLLAQPKVQLVKAFYRRDLAVAGMAQPGDDQGGRVARPGGATPDQPAGGRRLPGWSSHWRASGRCAGSCWSRCRSHAATGSSSPSSSTPMSALDCTPSPRVGLGAEPHVHQDLASLGVMAAEILAAAT